MASYFRRLYQIDHLNDAWRKLHKKKHSRGFDQQSIERFGCQLDHNIERISQELRSGHFAFQPLLGFLLDKSDGSKRPLKIPAVRDRVVMKAIHLLVAHKFRKYDLPCSFGYIRRRSTADAVKRVRELASQGKTWVLEGDIAKFFDTVDRSLLMSRFVREIRLPSLANLISRALELEIGNLEAFSPHEKDMFPLADSGVPQGGVLSPLLANFYLYPFDRAMTNAGFDLVRYADDFVVMCESPERAHHAYDLAKRLLEGNLRLVLHSLAIGKKTKITLYSKGFTFLGLHFQGGLVRPTARAIDRFRENISRTANPRHGLNLRTMLVSLQHAIEGWANAYTAYDCLDVFRTLDQHIRQAVSQYCRFYDFMQTGHLPSARQMRILGVPCLESILQKRQSQQHTENVSHTRTHRNAIDLTTQSLKESAAV
jgi:RNA-directed DNA polymerase